MTGFRYAFSLSKREVKDAIPAGTMQLVDHQLERASMGDETASNEIRLFPTPSLDPADPLNWPKWRKIGILLSQSIFAFVGNFLSSSISSALPILATPLAFNPPIPYATLTHLIAVFVLLQGASNLWWVPLANTFGRRTINLIALLIAIFCSVWAGVDTGNFNSLLAARIFMGIGVAPSETVSPDVVGEIFFAHERGRAMGIYTLFLACGSLVGSITGGYIAQNGIAWIQWVNVILCVITFVLCFFFQPETLFDRTLALAMAPREDVEMSEIKTAAQKREREGSATSTIPIQAHEQFAPYTFARSLSIGTYRSGVLQKFIGPILTLRLPGVWLVMLWYAGLVGGIVTISTVGPNLVAAPPYLWGNNAGLINIGGLIGSFLGAFATYALADWAVKRGAKKESTGYAEAEDRLPIAMPALFIATIGLWTFGFCANNPGPKMWIGMEFGAGMLAFGLMQAPAIGFNYMIEAYNAVSGDCFVMITCMRAIISFSWTFFVTEWSNTAGPSVPFGVFGGLMGFFGLLTIPQYLWGKRTRIATQKWLPAYTDH